MSVSHLPRSETKKGRDLDVNIVQQFTNHFRYKTLFVTDEDDI